MKHGTITCGMLLLATAMFATPVEATTTVLTFEDIGNYVPIGSVYPGLTFNNGWVITPNSAYPPHSGSKVATDEFGHMSIDFSSPITSFSGYITSLADITVSAYNGTTFLGSITTDGPNYIGADIPPNQFFSLNFDAITSVRFSDQGDGSYTLDDVTYGDDVVSPPPSAVPEPASWAMMMIGLGIVGSLLRRNRAGAPGSDDMRGHLAVPTR